MYLALRTYSTICARARWSAEGPPWSRPITWKAVSQRLPGGAATHAAATAHPNEPTSPGHESSGVAVEEVRGLCAWVAAAAAARLHGDPAASSAMLRLAADDVATFSWRLLFKGKDSISNMLTQHTAYQAVKLRLGGHPGPAIERRLLGGELGQRGVYVVRGQQHCCAVDTGAGVLVDGRAEVRLSAETLRAAIGAPVEAMEVRPKKRPRAAA